jgi:hypothetical protein
VLLLLVTAVPAIGVQDSEELAQFASEGEGADQIFLPRGMASDPNPPGHLFVADSGNRRIDEFTPWGQFVKAFGWGVSNGAMELQTCTTSCQRGLAGTGKGQFGNNSPFDIAVDSHGAIYAVDSDNNRVQKFNAAGDFVLMFGGGVDKTSGGNICTAAGDTCGAGSSGSGPGEFAAEGSTAIAITPDDHLLVGDAGRIQEFDEDGLFIRAIATTGTPGGISLDPTGQVVYVYFRGQNNVHRLDFTSGAETLPPLPVSNPIALRTDPAGNIYVAKESVGPPQASPQVVVEFDQSGTEVGSCCSPAPIPGKPTGNEERFFVTGIGVNSADDLYVANRSFGGEGSYLTVYGPPPLSLEPPPAVPPSIVEEFATQVTDSSATVKAKINPNFWGDTKYFVEYGLSDCATNSCSQQPGAPGAALSGGPVKKALVTDGVALPGLIPSTTYHFRFVAQSGGGGPVVGPDHTFTTFPAPVNQGECPLNEAFRTGLNAALPDCRAYEMVSPIDKENGDILTRIDIIGYQTRLNQAALSGDALTYSSYRTFGGAAGAPYTAQYLATRSSAGWLTEPMNGPLISNFYDTNLLSSPAKAFSSDLCTAWVAPGGDPPLAAGASPGYPNLYRRANCPPSYEALTTVAPPDLPPEKFVPDLQGFSATGGVALIRAYDNLTPDAPAQTAGCLGGVAPPECQARLYEAGGGSLRYVCIFPAGTPPKVQEEFPNCSAGSPAENNLVTGVALSGHLAEVTNAMSADGNVTYWSASKTSEVMGRIYARVNSSETRKVSETETTKASRFWGASESGRSALFEVEDPETAKNRDLYLYSLDTESSSLVAGKVIGVAAMSEDLSRIYFVSEEVLPGTSGATPNAPNLYLDEEGGDTFIATLAADDVVLGRGTDPALNSNVSVRPVFHVAAATEDGARLVFISTEPLTGFDNIDANSGEPDSEVFTYDATTHKLSCASCAPSNARPEGQLVEAQGNTGRTQWTAATVPAGETQLYTPRALAGGGSKLFFTSYASLLPRDTDGVADVYEWEAPGSSDSCKTESSPAFSVVNGGCLFLISTGMSNRPSEFVDSGASGRDVFFTTEDGLVPQDPGLVDVYDAREGGGFEPPLAKPLPCVGEACQAFPQVPVSPSPQTDVKRAGNPKLQCPKGTKKVAKKGKAGCVKKKHKKKAGKKGRHHARSRAHRPTLKRVGNPSQGSEGRSGGRGSAK